MVPARKIQQRRQIANVEFFHNPVAVGTHGFIADVHLPGDIHQAQPLRQITQHLQFAAGKLGQRGGFLIVGF